MAKRKEARRPFNLKKRSQTPAGIHHPAALGNLYHCASGMGIRGKFFNNSEIFQGKALKFESGLHFENYAKAWNGAGVAGFFRKLSDLFSNFLHNTDSGVCTCSLCTVQI